MVNKYRVKILLALFVVLAAFKAEASCEHWQGKSNILDRFDLNGLCLVTGHPDDDDMLYRSEMPKARFWVSKECTRRTLTNDFQLALFLSPSEFELARATLESRQELRQQFNADLIKILTDDAWHWCRWLQESAW